MTRQVKRIAEITVLMFLSLMVMATSIQVIRADELYADSRNVRAAYESYKTQRGDILIDNEPIVYNETSQDAYRFQRVYASELYSHITGYFSLFQGSTGLEHASNNFLSGQNSAQFFEQINALLSGEPSVGASIELTIDPAIQEIASDALGTKKGVVIALDPRTGEILAMVSKPTYDPNKLAVHSSTTASENYSDLLADENEPLFNRAIGGDLYTPGSVFKLVVAAAAFESGRFTPETELPNPVLYELPGTTTKIANASGKACGSGETVTIATALTYSCNIPFAILAGRVGADRIRSEAELMGFGSSFGIPMNVTPSIYPDDLNEPQTELTGFGQYDVRVTPLQMAMVVSAIANQGVIMKPTLIEQIIASNLSVLEEPEPEVFGAPISQKTAAQLTQMMLDSVQLGVANNAQISGIAVAGKTGTAENGPDDPYTLWFAGFAPAERPEVVVVVMLEDGGGAGQSGTGNALAAPIARKVLKGVLER